MGFREILAKTAGKIKSTAAKATEKVSGMVRKNKSAPDSAAVNTNPDTNNAYPHTNSDAIPDKIADNIPDTLPDNIPDNIPDTNSDATPEINADKKTGRVDKTRSRADEESYTQAIEVEVLPTVVADKKAGRADKKRFVRADKESDARVIEVRAEIVAPSYDAKSEVVTAKTVQKKQYVSLTEKIRRKIFLTRIVFSLLSMLLYTTFTVIMLQRNWGNTVYNTVVLCFIGLYVVLFLGMIILSQRLNKSGKKLTRSFKDYKSGLKIMNSVLRLINFALTLSVLFTAAASRKTNTPFQTTVMIVSVVWAIFQIFFQVYMIRRRHKTAKARR